MFSLCTCWLELFCMHAAVVIARLRTMRFSLPSVCRLACAPVAAWGIMRLEWCAHVAAITGAFFYARAPSRVYSSVVLCLVHVAACAPVAASVSAVAGTDCRSESESLPLNARSVESAGSCRKRECAACMNFVRARCRTRRIQCLCFCRPAIRVSPPSWC